LLWVFAQMTQPCWRKARKIRKNTNKRTAVGLSVFDSPQLKRTGASILRCPGPVCQRTPVFSHGLKKCPPDTFLPSLRSGRPFKSLLISANKNSRPVGRRFVVYWLQKRYFSAVFRMTLNTRAKTMHSCIGMMQCALRNIVAIYDTVCFSK